MISTSTFSRTLFRSSKFVACNVRCQSTATKASSSANPDCSQWRIAAAVSVERIPLITPELNSEEQKMVDLLDRIETEISLKCDHELRQESDQ